MSGGLCPGGFCPRTGQNSCIETALSKEPLFLALADIRHKNNIYSRNWRRLISVCIKPEPPKSESNKILAINVLQKLNPHALLTVQWQILSSVSAVALITKW